MLKASCRHRTGSRASQACRIAVCIYPLSIQHYVNEEYVLQMYDTCYRLSGHTFQLFYDNINLDFLMETDPGTGDSGSFDLICDTLKRFSASCGLKDDEIGFRISRIDFK